MKAEEIGAQLEIIERTINPFPNGASLEEILTESGLSIKKHTLLRRLDLLRQQGKVQMQGQKKGARYFLVKTALNRLIMEGENYANISEPPVAGKDQVPLSMMAQITKRELSKPVTARKAVGYNRFFLESYRPNHDFYLSEAERGSLRKTGSTYMSDQAAAGTYARQMLNRLLIDLSWNSSRLEGNTYSLLDTQQLIEMGEQASGKPAADAQMILNHKEAIEFLLSDPDGEIGFNRYTILNLHAILANNLLPDPSAPGRLRKFGVGIGQSVYTPLPIPQQIEEMFDLMLLKAGEIKDPFEQAIFIMVQLPYLQPFEDVNKRVSRLAANLPLNKSNLIPLSFIGVPPELYFQGLLGVYEKNNTSLLRDIFLWAYEQSANRYATIRQTIGEPDPFRVKYKDLLHQLIREIIEQGSDRQRAGFLIRARALQLPGEHKSRFTEMVETELLSLHEGNFARYQIRPAVFKNWKKAWDKY